jgi:DNA processing protein
VFQASRSELSEFGLSAPQIAYLQAPDWAAVERDIAWLSQPGRRLLDFSDTDYPDRLRETRDPPPLLFVQGHSALLSGPQIAMVGSRNPSPGGLRAAGEFAGQLASLGIGVTSGLALGIDAAAHRGALAAGGPTLAVMGTGLDRVYPASHRDLAIQIAGTGALVSEFPLGTPAARANFPRRNRIISGLCLGVLVVEAAARSGSLITASHASEQGREVFAVPGSIYNPLARGCHALIRQGARLVERVEDILEELAPQLRAQLATHQSVAQGAANAETRVQSSPRDDDYRQLLAHMGFDPVGVDTLVERCGLTAQAVSSMLLILELDGEVQAQPGGNYVRLPRERMQ